MPDLILVFNKWGKYIFGVTLAATILALVISLLVPKEYMAVVTALPANSAQSDKARIFNQQIESLYPDLGTPEELDKFEGTGELDTIYVATAREFNLDRHYNIDSSGESLFKAARKLKKNSEVTKSGFGEIKIRVWDEDRNLSAALANQLFETIQAIHQRIQNQTNQRVLQNLQADRADKKAAYMALSDSISRASGAYLDLLQSEKTSLLQQLQTYNQLIDQYQLTVKSNPPALIPVERAAPPLWADKPRVMAIVLFTLFGAFVFTFLSAFYMESRKVTS